VLQVRLSIVTGPGDDVDALVEAAKARKTEELRAAGKTREIIFDTPLVIHTGVPRSPGYRQHKSAPADPDVMPWWRGPESAGSGFSPPENLSDDDPQSVVGEPVASEGHSPPLSSRPDIAETWVYAIIRNP
jgi:hypothetical protein